MQLLHVNKEYHIDFMYIDMAVMQYSVYYDPVYVEPF